MSKYSPCERASWHPWLDTCRHAGIREANRCRSVAVLPKLLIRAEGKPMQAELPAMRLLPKLFGLLLISKLA